MALLLCSAEGFLDGNLGTISSPCFRGAVDRLEGTGSINPFVKDLFSAKAIATQARVGNSHLPYGTYVQHCRAGVTFFYIELFDLTAVAAAREPWLAWFLLNQYLKYGVQLVDSIFPLQVSALFNDGYTARHGFVGYTPNALSAFHFQLGTLLSAFYLSAFRNLVNTGHPAAIYNGLNYNPFKTSHVTVVPADVDVNNMDSSVLDLFKFNSGQDTTKKLNYLKIDSNAHNFLTKFVHHRKGR
ncbi:hypothetical protein BYT27DRAFT_7209022 [Phlegmacium glaucopus]|nr:hypothetical protein BYT27DRAFT_7209022 [Phlegmacium glaucopus]